MNKREDFEQVLEELLYFAETSAEKLKHERPGTWGRIEALCAKVRASALDACEICDGTGGVTAFQNGRSGTHPCPRGCKAAP